MQFRYIYRKLFVLLITTLFLLTLSNLPTNAAPTLVTITEADIGGEWGDSLAGITDIGTLSDTTTVLSGTGSSGSDHEYIRFTIPSGGQLTSISATGTGGGTWQLFLDDTPIDFAGLHVNVSSAAYPAGNLLISALPAGDYDIYVRNQNATPPANWTVTLTATMPTPSPGGVGSNLAFWVKADASVFSDLGTTPAINGSFVRQWNTQAGSMTTEVQNATATNIQYITNGANFNPAVQFDGTSANSLKGNSSIPSTTPSTIFAVAQPNSSVSGVDGIFTGGGSGGQAGPGIYWHSVNAYILDGSGGSTPNTANTPPLPYGNYHVVSGQYAQSGTTQNSSMFLNGDLTENFAGAGVTVYNTHANFEVGGRSYGGFDHRIFDGNITEVIYYDTALNATDRNKVESYLAIKYGITLTGTQGISYTLSDNTIVWNANTNATYHHDVAGIAQDDDSALYQPQSMSINSDALITISGTVGTNLSALLWGNNNGTTSLNQTAGSYLHMARVWKTSETGSVGNVRVSIPDSYGATHLLVDSDTDFSNPTAIVLTTTVGSSSATFNFSDGQYFTFAKLGTLPANMIGNALNFDGTDDYIALDGTFGSGWTELTVEAWVRAHDVSTLSAIVSSTSYEFVHFQIPGNIGIYADGGGPGVSVNLGSVALPENEWHHLAASFSSGDSRLYLDGVEIASSVETYTLIDPTSALRIGSGFGAARFFDGQLDEVRIWNVARTQGEIQANMHGELTGLSGGLVAYYQMEDGQGKGSIPITSLTDQTTNGNDGSLANMNGLTGWNGRLWISDTVAANGGITMTNSSFLQDNGDDITFWFTDTLNANIANDVPLGVDVRWLRIWTSMVEDTGSNGGTVDITFDFDDVRMGGGLPPAGPLSNYVLLYRTGTTGNFTILVDGASSLSAGDRTVAFTNVDSTILNGQITLGTKDVATSPTAVTIQTIATQNSNLTFVMFVLLLLVGLSGFVWWRRTEQL